MSRKMLPETFIEFYKQWVHAIPENEQCDIIWHGGEPTLRGIKFYEQVFEACFLLTPANKIVSHAMQTNGVSMTPRWANLFRHYGIQVGVSIDGPAALHNSLRVNSLGLGTFDKAMRSYKLLTSLGMSTGVVVVVNKYNVHHPEAIFRFMHVNNIKRLQLSPCLEIGSEPDDYSINGIEFADFICKLYDLLIESDDPDVSIGFIEDIVKFMLGYEHENCMLNDKCHNFAVLDWTGEIKSCDGMRNRQVKIGDLGNGGIASQPFQSKWRDVHEVISKSRLDNCAHCSWYQICHGGCPYHWPDNGPEKTIFCEAHKSIFTHIANSMSKF